MATLPTRSFTVIVQNLVAGIQGRASALIDFSDGSPLRAISESVAGAGLWLQAFAAQIWTAARLATASGSDVDTFVADFGLSRLASSNATGPLNYTRFSPSASAPFVPVGATVMTADASQVVTVIADTTNANYSAAANGYTMPAGATTLGVTAQANSPGPAGNVAAGTATVMTTPVTGLDQVSNSLAFVGGQLAETDSALKMRFVLFILGLSRGNLYGIESALANLNVAIAYTITDQQTYGGVQAPGYFYAVVDDGSGSPSSQFLANANTAINAARALGVNYSVFAPNLLSANINATLTTAAGYLHSSVVTQVQMVLTANILALGLGAGLPYSLIAAWCFSVPGVTNASALTLNGGTTDIPPNNQIRVMPGTITVS